MKKLTHLILIILILIIGLWVINIPFSFSYNSINQSLNFLNDNKIETSVCLEEETEVNLTITVWADPAQTVYITLTPGADWIKPQNPVFQFQATPEGYTFQTKIILSAEGLSPGEYNSTLKIEYQFLQSETTKEETIPVILHVLKPEFEVNPETLRIIMKPTDTKGVQLIVRMRPGCNVGTIFITQLDKYDNVDLMLYENTITLNLYNPIEEFKFGIKTSNLDKTVTIRLQFQSQFSTKIVNLIVSSAISITITGKVVEVNEKEGYIIIETFDGERFKVNLRDEDKGKYKEGDYLKVTGIFDEDKDEIEPEEIVEVVCGVSISDPEDITFCPTCPEIKYGGEEIPEENVKSIKITVKNNGNIPVTVSGGVELSQKVATEEDIDVKINPESLSLKPGEEKEIAITASVKKSSNTGAYFKYKLNFNISPSPPCNKEIAKEFEVTLCPTIRKISGSVKFLNPRNQECSLKGIKVLLFLNYEPKCEVDELFKKIEGNLKEVHSSFNTGLPNRKYYLETYTNEDGEFSLYFYDFDCKHDYTLAVIFETKEFKVKYHDCSNLFFAKVSIKDNSKPCPKHKNKRAIVIGKDTDLTFPDDFDTSKEDPRAIAQIFCHIREAFDIFRNEECSGEKMLKDSMLPLTVCAFSNTKGTWYLNRKINIHKSDSPITSTNRPTNREWHEFGHFLHDSLYGIPSWASGDRNHFGLANSNTTDSFLEGFAEATSLFILRQIKLKGTCCLDVSSLRNGIYGWGGGMSDLENGRFKSDTANYGYFDSHNNFHRVNRSNVKCVGGELKDAAGHKIIMFNSDEEFGVASLLIDLLDQGSWYDEVKNNVVIHGRDDDGFSFSNWRDFFCLLKEKKIQNIKELYDALREKFKDNKSALEKIDKIFIEHGFFKDKDFDGVRDSGEKIGVTYRCKTRYFYQEENPSPPPDYIWHSKSLPRIEERKDFPLIPQANILVYLMDRDGNPVESGTLVVEVLSFDGRVNFSYEREARSKEPFYIFITPNGDEILRIHMKNSKEKPLIVTEDELWTSAINNKEHVKEHTFRMVEEESPPEVKLLIESLNFGSLLKGETRSLLVPFVNSGGGSLSINVSTSQSWISVEPETFEGNTGFIKVTVDTEGLSGGVHEGKVIVSGNGGEREIKVNVSITPKLKKTVIELFIGSESAYINGEVHTLDAAPYIKPPGRTMVPLRFISEGLGVTVDYWPKKGKVKEVYIYFKGKKITLYIGKNEALIDERHVYLDAAPEIKPPGRTFVPIRFIAETFGADVGWDSVLRKVTITLEEEI